MQSHPKTSFEPKGRNLIHATLPIDVPSSSPSLSSTCSSSDTEVDGISKQLVLYDPLANGNGEIEADPDPIRFQPPPLLTYPTRHAPRVLPSVGAFTVQCAKCFKWRLIPTKQRYEAIRERILEVPFVCDAAREWRPNISCHDPEDISQDGSRLWAIDKPNIAQPPPGWQRLLRIRGEGSTKFADVYYASPCGKRLRSTVEIQKYLVENPEYIRDGVTMSQFSFQIPKPLQEDYVRKRPRCMAPYDGTNLGMSRTLEPAEAHPISWAGPNTCTDLQLGGAALVPSLPPSTYVDTEHLVWPPMKKQARRTPSKQIYRSNPENSGVQKAAGQYRNHDYNL